MKDDSKGVSQWVLPNTQNGLQPTQSWHAIGSSPNGDIFIGGMDHETNSALYLLSGNEIAIVGDARSASEVVNNWLADETAEKFHTRPTWCGGKIYVASLDRSTLDYGSQTRRGFHWYSYDPSNGEFLDLSASEPKGVGAEKCGLVTIQANPRANELYGFSLPAGELFKYAVNERHTISLGRPQSFDRPFIYSGRFMWMDRNGRLYFTAGNPLWGDYNSEIYGHVHYFDTNSQTFGERRDWKLVESRAIETGQWTSDSSRCFLADDAGNIYCFSHSAPNWRHLGRIESSKAHRWFWVFNVSGDSSFAYLISSSREQAANPAALYEFNLATGESKELCSVVDLARPLADRKFHTGYDAWDREGRFHFASFNDDRKENVLITRIDPILVKRRFGK
jgi:hypothetical protein